MFKILLMGYITGLGLIVAIGPQNTFVIKQGIKREHHLLIASICSFSDILLILLGVLGLGTFIQRHPGIIRYSSLFGAILLFLYGLQHVKAVLTPQKHEVYNSSEQTNLLNKIIFTLGITFLNPHVYLDTVILLGSMSANHPGTGRFLFGGGSMLASLTWFFGIAIGAEKLSPLFSKRVTWRILDMIISIIMFYMAYKLLLLFNPNLFYRIA